MRHTNARTQKQESVLERMTREVSEVGSGRREPARAISTKSGSFYRVGMHDGADSPSCGKTAAPSRDADRRLR